MKKNVLVLALFGALLVGCSSPKEEKKENKSEATPFPSTIMKEDTQIPGLEDLGDQYEEKEDKKGEKEGENSDKKEAITVKDAEVLEFGSWNPEASQSVLGKVAAGREGVIMADIGGNLTQMLAEVGDRVYAGQVLARYRASDNNAEVTYQNAVTNATLVGLSADQSVSQAQAALQSTTLSLNEQVQSAEIALENAKNNAQAAERAAQVALSNAIANKQASENAEAEGLDSLTVNINTTSQSAKQLVQRVYSLLNDVFEINISQKTNGIETYAEIGNHDILARSRLKSDIRSYFLSQGFSFREIAMIPKDKTPDGWNEELELLEGYLLRLDSLTRNTRANRTITEATINALLGQIQTELGQLRGLSANLTNLMAQKIAQQSRVVQSNLGGFTQVEQAEAALETQQKANESQIKSAESQLENVKTQAEAQIVQLQEALESAKAGAKIQKEQAEAQVRFAGLAKADLQVVSPFSGIITEVLVDDYAQVGVGQQLFRVLSKNAGYEVLVSVTKDEADAIAGAGGVEIGFNNGEKAMAMLVNRSGVVNGITQKENLSLELPNLPNGAAAGQRVQVKIPIKANTMAIVPLSAVSFEPSGAEVLIVNDNGIAERRKIEVGAMQNGGIVVDFGLEINEMLVRYRNRVNTGDMINPIR